jgi:hypothetical protein
MMICQAAMDGIFQSNEMNNACLHHHSITPTELLEAIKQIVDELQVTCYSTYHSCTAIADIARAGMDIATDGNPYFTSIESLARKEDEHASRVSDLFATCEQMIVELRAAMEVQLLSPSTIQSTDNECT